MIKIFRIIACIVVVITGTAWCCKSLSTTSPVRHAPAYSTYEVNKVATSFVANEITWLNTLPTEAEILSVTSEQFTFVTEDDNMTIQLKIPAAKAGEYRFDNTIFENQEDKEKYRSLEVLSSDEEWVTLSFNYKCGRGGGKLPVWVRETAKNVYAQKLILVGFQLLCSLLVAVVIVLPYKKIVQYYKKKEIGYK